MWFSDLHSSLFVIPCIPWSMWNVSLNLTLWMIMCVCVCVCVGAQLMILYMENDGVAWLIHLLSELGDWTFPWLVSGDLRYQLPGSCRSRGVYITLCGSRETSHWTTWLQVNGKLPETVMTAICYTPNSVRHALLATQYHVFRGTFHQGVSPKHLAFMHYRSMCWKIRLWTNVIILQTVLDEVRHRSSPGYKRIKESIGSSAKHFCTFVNEFHKYAQYCILTATCSPEHSIFFLIDSVYSLDWHIMQCY